MKTNQENFSSNNVSSNNKGKETRGVSKFVLQSRSPYDNPQGRLISERGLCMKGGIYPGTYRERCPICESKFRNFEPNGLWCPHHPQCRPSSYQVRFGKLTNRFKSYEEAYRRLIGWRHETDLGKFDIRDYRKNNPLGFSNLVDEYLNDKRLLKSVRKYEERLRFARDKFQNRNIKEIKNREIKGFFNELIEQGHSYTYRRLISETMKAFYNWINDDEEIKIPKFPKFNKKNMAWRNIVRKSTQLKILDKVKELTYDINPRIYIGILFLITYISLRPNEIIGLKEKNIDFENRWILVGDKNSELEEAKHVPILPDHLKLLKKEMRKHPAHPNLHFFRHLKGMGGNPPNSPFGKGYLYNKWIKACNELGIENVDLYGGTRHSSQVALRKKGHDTKDIKRAAMTTTDEAHMRYCQINDEELRRLYADANPDNELITFSVSSKKHN